MPPEMDKLIVCGPGRYFYIVYADTFKYWRDLEHHEQNLIMGRGDWEAVKPFQKKLSLGA